MGSKATVIHDRYIGVIAPEKAGTEEVFGRFMVLRESTRLLVLYSLCSARVFEDSGWLIAAM